MSKRDQSPSIPEPPADAWRDAWSEDREANRVFAMRDLSATIDDRYDREDYLSALKRAAASI